MASRSDFSEYTVKELQRFLTERGVPCFKKSKAELVLLGKEAENRYSPIEPDNHIKSERKRWRTTRKTVSLAIGLDVREKLTNFTKDLYGWDVRWRNELVDVGPTSPLQARIQGFFLGARKKGAPPLQLSAIFFLYSNPQMLIFPCPLNFIVVFSLPN